MKPTAQIALLIFVSLIFTSCKIDKVVCKVVDSSTKEPVQGAVVRRNRTTTEVRKSGVFYLYDVSKKDKIKVYADCYTTQVQKLSSINELDTVTIFLSRSAKCEEYRLEDSINALKWEAIDSKYVSVDLDSIRKSDGGLVIPLPEQIAEFPGGMQELNAYLSENLNYPDESVEAGASGKVILRFIVQADGQVTHVEVLKSVGYFIDREAIRVVRKMPKWVPAQNENIPVESYFALPVMFQLQ